MQKTHKITRYLHKTTFKNLLVLHYCLTKNFILMKKMVLTLALVLVGSFAFANNDLNLNIEVQIQNVKMIKEQWYKATCTNGSVYYFQAENMTTAEYMAKFICSQSILNN